MILYGLVSFTAFADSCIFIEDFSEEVSELEEESLDSACMAVAGAFFIFFVKAI